MSSKRTFVIAMLAITGLLMGMAQVSADEPETPAAPRLRAHIPWDSVDAWDYPQGAELHLTIDDLDTGLSPDFEMDTTVVWSPEWDPSIDSTWFSFAGQYDLQPNDLVTVSDGTTTRTHLVQNLAITAVNTDLDTVAGTADPGALVRLPMSDERWATVVLYAEAQSDGTWQADFSGQYDIRPGTMVIAEVFEADGDQTSFEWHVPNSRFTAFPVTDQVEAMEWPIGIPIHLSVDDPATAAAPDFEADGTPAPPEWDPNIGWLLFDFPGVYDLKPGDSVTLSNGSLTLTHVVRDLAVAGTNEAAELIAGTADPGAQVHVWPHGAAVSPVQATANGSGQWHASFVGIFDLAAGVSGRASIFDGAGNDTAVDWTVTAIPPVPTSNGVRVPADAGWVDSGYLVSEGMPVAIRAEGQATLAFPADFRESRSGPDGQLYYCEQACALDGALYGALVGKIGEGGEPFLIGSSFVLSPAASGSLYLAVNDNAIYYSDNHGNYMVFFSN